MTSKLHTQTIQWLANYLKQNGTETIVYRDIMFCLKDQKQYPIRCYLLDNKYLFGSYISEAKDLLAQNNILEISL